MEDSFNAQEFNSIVNPSPPFKKKPAKRNPPTKLALKKTLRRSSMYDKMIPSVENSRLNVVNAESTESSSCSSSQKSAPEPVKPRKGFIVINDSKSTSSLTNTNNRQSTNNLVNDTRESHTKATKDEVLIIDSTDDEAVIPPSTETTPEKHVSISKEVTKPLDLLSQTKYESIKSWVQSVTKPKEKISASPRTPTKATPKVKKAVNSTFVFDKTCVPFDKWLTDTHNSEKKKDAQKNSKGLKPTLPETPNQWIKKYLGSKEVENILLDEDSPKENLTKAKSKDDKETIVKTKSKKGTLIEQQNNDNIQTNKTEKRNGKLSDKADDVLITPTKQLISKNDDVANLLDNLYGNAWHKNKAQIFSEPRPKKIQINKLKEPRTERKPPRELLYKNPYLDSEKQKSIGLLKSLQERRVQENLESPFFARAEAVDDDTPPTDARKCNNKEIDEYILDLDMNLDDRLKKKIQLPKPVQLKFLDDSDSKPISKTTKKTYRRIISESNSDDDSSKSSSSTGSNRKGTKYSVSSGSSDDSRSPRKTRGSQQQKTDQKTTDLADRIENITIHDSSESELSDSDSEYSFLIKTKKGSKVNKPKEQTPKVLSFLASLSKNTPIEICDPSALIYKNNFKKHRDALTKKLFDLFNEKIFDKSIPSDTPIEWSVRMRGTAGLCRCFKKTNRLGTTTRLVRLQLSTKVLDSADRLRDTLVHEMCHAATFLINEVSDGHGPFWKAWAAKAMRTFPELPPIKRCHDYAINYKYTYKCTSCGYSFGRHRKTLDIDGKRCGHCYGKFEVLINKVNQKGDKKTVPCTPKKEPTAFAKFVKENYAIYKSPGLNHAELMKYLGKKYAETKN